MNGILTRIEGGYRIKETETHYIDVVRMLYNWRVVRTPKNSPLTWDRGWCYSGTGWDTLMAAALAAWNWDGGDDTEPPGWNKNVQTGEIREPGRERA